MPEPTSKLTAHRLYYIISQLKRAFIFLMRDYKNLIHFPPSPFIKGEF